MNLRTALTAVLVDLLATYRLMQSLHWQASGASYYGDHLLYQRIYEGISKEIDSVGERLVGLYGPAPVDAVRLERDVSRRLASSRPHADNEIQRALALERATLATVERAAEIVGARDVGTGKYAQKLCAGDVKSDEYSVTISAKAGGKSYTESNARAVRGMLQGKSAVSDGHIAFPCEDPPYAYAVIESMNAIVGNLPNAPVVEIAYVPDFASFDKKQVHVDTDKNLILLSDETGLNPVLFAAVVAAVGSPYTIRHEITEYKSGKKMSIHREGPVFVSGPNGVGLAMPLRRAVHHPPEKKNPARSPQMEFRFKR